MVFEQCFICKSEKNDPVKYGKILESGEIAVHYYCLVKNKQSKISNYNYNYWTSIYFLIPAINIKFSAKW